MRAVCASTMSYVSMLAPLCCLPNMLVTPLLYDTFLLPAQPHFCPSILCEGYSGGEDVPASASRRGGRTVHR